MKHLIIPDCQVKSGVDLNYLMWIGRYIVDTQPDVIIQIGDFADMASLCSYDKGKRSFEGRRYKEDLKAARLGMDLLLTPLQNKHKHAVEKHRRAYKPRLVLTLGNHEERIERVTQLNPELYGVIGYNDLPYKDWEVVDYLKPINIDGVMYVHYLANPMTGQPYGGTAAHQLQKTGNSFIVGHKQILDIATRFTLEGSQQWGIIAGACYLHNEEYKGPQGNKHWRGVILLEDVKEGSFNPSFLSLDYLKERFA
ncbi:hypothetical protein UFOVP1_16 [uncultured Caudovirales phage]|uniref:Calcineurin-like phosphoesterase domain-containing protein n=1 Tax=uncultured Caudovirales phage TaxID=2100421 RepID=A0A6J5KHL9_9CAUD|nr:hypothetical protein UFOVP1_16 [uncultured Caudovirales phage]